MLLQLTFQHADQKHTLEIRYKFTFDYLKSSLLTPYKDVAISLDGNFLGSIANGREIRDGKEFTLPLDGNPVLKVKVNYSFLNYSWALALDGQAMPNPIAYPLDRLKGISYLLLAIAVWNISIGLISYILAKMNIHYLENLDFGLNSVIWGILYAILSIFVRRKSSIALGIALALYILETVEVIYNEIISQCILYLITALIFRLCIILLLTYGFKAIRELKQIIPK